MKTVSSTGVTRDFKSRGKVCTQPANGDADRINWYIDPRCGDDTWGTGGEKKPIATLAEFSRRLRRSGWRYSESFSPVGYVLHLLGNIPKSDAIQFGGTIIATGDGGVVLQQEDTGTIMPLLTINGEHTKAVAGSTGTVQMFSSATAYAAAAIQRTSGAWTLNTVGRFTKAADPDLEGRIFYPIPVSPGSSIAYVNERFGGATVTPGDTFELITLTRLASQLNWSGSGAQGTLLILNDVWVPGNGENGTFDDDGPKPWQTAGTVIRYNGSLINQAIMPNLAGRAKEGSGAKPSAVIFPVPATEANLAMYTVERGAYITFSTTFANVCIDVLPFQGQFQHGDCLFVNAPVRCGGSANESVGSGTGQLGVIGQNTISVDFPSFVPPNPFVGTGGVGDKGAALILQRAGFASYSDGWRGSSAKANTVGLRIRANGKLEQAPNLNATVTGVGGPTLSDISFDDGANIPRVDPATGLATAGSNITSWADLNATYGAGGWGGNAMALNTGTLIYTAPTVP
jgi:hypothetical protein